MSQQLCPPRQINVLAVWRSSPYTDPLGPWLYDTGYHMVLPKTYKPISIVLNDLNLINLYVYHGLF